MAIQRTTLDGWIQDAINDVKDSGKISRIILMHMQGVALQELHTFSFKGDLNITAKELANMFRGKATTYAQDLDGRQMFMLQAYYGSNEPEARHPFTVAQPAEVNGLTTESPDDRGLTMQNMRHKEALISQVYQRQAQLDSHSLRIIERQAEMINHLQVESFQNLELIKEMMFKMADNTHRYRMEEIQAREAAETKANLLKMAPSLVNTLTGRNVFPESVEDSALIETIADHVTVEQVENLGMLGMPPTVVAALATRVQKAMTKKRKVQEESAQLPAFKGKAEDDIAGGSE